MAETLVAMGHRVALIDVDLGQGACSLLLNETPRASVLEFAQHMALAEDVLHRTESGITLSQGVADAGKVSDPTLLFSALDELLVTLRKTHDYILLDTPAGTEGAVRWALDRADLGILVLVGEPTAISDAYRLTRMIWDLDPEYPMGAVVNFADTEAEARSVVDRFGKVTEYFTGKVTKYLGWVPFSAQIRRSVQNQRPAVQEAGPVKNAFQSMAENFTKEPLFAPGILSLN
jgi:flagellar biosynthesis protein FlhG